MDLETASFQWDQGARRLRGVAPERRPVLERVVGAIVTELRRRLGGAFTLEELAVLYGQDHEWAIDVAVRTAPEDAEAWDAATVVDAAFGRYRREAADFAGGRRLA